MSTIANLLSATYGGNVTTTKPTLAPSGFTVKTLEAATEGVSTTADGHLLTGMTMPGNASTQGITFANLSVDANSGKKFRMAIRPNLANTTASLYRNRASTGTTLESLNYNAVNSTGIDRSQFLFSSTKLGDDYLDLGGTVKVTQAAAHLQTGGSAPTVYGTTGTGGSLGAALTGSEASTVLGSWAVKVDVQALLSNFESFTLLAGSPVLGDDVLETTAGAPIKFSLMPTLADADGNFITDYVVDPSKHQIVKQFTTTSVRFAAGSYIPEGTVVKISTYTAGTTSLTGGNYMQYAYNAYPVYNIDLPQGSTMEIAVDIAEGFVVPGGQLVPTGSNFTDVTGAITDKLTLVDFQAKAGFSLPSGFALTGVILMDGYAKVKKGLTSSLFQPVVAGIHTTDDLSLQAVQFIPGSSLESDMTVDSDFHVLETIIMHKGSLVKKGSRIPKGSQTLEGALIDSTITIAKGASVTSRVEIKSPFVVEASAAGSNPISAGAILNGPFTFPPGTQLTSGNFLPAALKLLMTMGTTLSAGMKLAAGTLFGSTAMLFGDVGFSPTGSIPSLSTLNGVFTLPLGTKLGSGFTSNFVSPVPDHTVFPAGSTIHVGTTFKEGATIPTIADLSAQAGAAYVSGAAVGPLTKFTDTGALYLVLKAGTVFMPGWQFPVGSIMSAVAAAGHTGALGTSAIGVATTTSPVTDDYDLAPGSYSLDEGAHSPAQDTFSFVPGVATTALVVMLTDTTLPTDVVIPFSQIEPTSGQYLSFNDVFTVAVDIVLSEAYTVHGSNNVTWPANVPILSEFVLSSAFTFTASNSQISKAIHFNVPTTAEFINGIMSSTSSIKLPPAGFTLDAPIKLAVAQPVANTGSNAFKATVTLASGTELATAAAVTLVVPMHVTNNFTVDTALVTFPRMRLENGIVLLAGQTTPGDIVVGINSPLPKNLTLDQEVTLAADLETKEATYTLNEFAYLAAGTKLARGTYFGSGANFVSGVTMSPILSLSTDNIFFLFEDNELSTDINIPYLYDSGSASVKTIKVDARALIQKIINLENSLAASELTIAGLVAAQ